MILRTYLNSGLPEASQRTTGEAGLAGQAESLHNRRGDVTKRSIGKIQILARETRVEISPTDAAHFAEAIRRPDTKDKHLHTEPVDQT